MYLYNWRKWAWETFSELGRTKQIRNNFTLNEFLFVEKSARFPLGFQVDLKYVVDRSPYLKCDRTGSRGYLAGTNTWHFPDKCSKICLLIPASTPRLYISERALADRRNYSNRQGIWEGHGGRLMTAATLDTLPTTLAQLLLNRNKERPVDVNAEEKSQPMKWLLVVAAMLIAIWLPRLSIRQPSRMIDLVQAELSAKLLPRQ